MLLFRFYQFRPLFTLIILPVPASVGSLVPCSCRGALSSLRRCAPLEFVPRVSCSTAPHFIISILDFTFATP